MRARHLLIVAGGLALAACASNSTYQSVLDFIDSHLVVDKLTAEQAAQIPDAAADDRILNGDITGKLKSLDIPFIDLPTVKEIRDKVVDQIVSTCTKRYLTAPEAAVVPGAEEGDPLWRGNCSELVKTITQKD